MTTATPTPAPALTPNPAPTDRPGRWMSWWYVVLGLGLAPGGATLAWAHLRAEGLTVTSVGGLVGLAAGATALVTGARGLLPRHRGWRRVLLVPVVLVVLYALVMPWCLAVYATFPPRPSIDRGAAERAGLDVTDLTFPAADGSELAAWYVPPRNGAVVIVLHGSSSTRANVVDQMAVFADAGYGVLAYDARGHGGSEGRGMEFGWTADGDVSAAIDDLVERQGADPERIVVYGRSLGGEVAIGAGGRDRRIAAVVAEGAIGRSAADHEWLADAYGWRGTAQLLVDRVTYGLTDALVPAGPPPPLRSAVAASSAPPVLMITAGDVPDEARAARWIQEGSPDTVDIWTVEGAGHTQGLRTAPEEWTERVLGFMDAALEDR